MGTHTMLELTLNEILHVINPTREDLDTRLRIIEELRNVVSTVESLRGATVEPFGSFLSQLYTRWGDLDISIELANGAYIATAAKKHKQTLLGDVLKALRKTGGFNRLQFVLHARVPILKLESRYQNISCDISINNLSGQLKSKFLLWCNVIDLRFRDMVLLVKEWAKANDINNPKTGSLNSYSLSLLVVFHFQTCAPAIFPPLRDIYPGNMADELIGIRADVERRIEEVSTSNIAKFRQQRTVNKSSLSELFTSFFAKFCNIGTRAAHQGICTFSAQWEDISTNTRWLPRTYAIFIEDPFEQPQNTARAVGNAQLIRIAEAFANTYHKLVSPNQSRNTLLSSLVRHQISHFFPGAAFGVAGTNSGPHRTANRNTRRGNHSSLQFQHQRFQNTRQRGPSNNATAQKSKQASNGQASTVNQQLPKNTNRTQAIQPSEVTRQGAVKPTAAGLPQQVKFQLPHSPFTRQANNTVGSQRPVKASHGQAQQVWRPKLPDK